MHAWTDMPIISVDQFDDLLRMICANTVFGQWRSLRLGHYFRSVIQWNSSSRLEQSAPCAAGFARLPVRRDLMQVQVGLYFASFPVGTLAIQHSFRHRMGFNF
jgi:hypothetical protein